MKNRYFMMPSIDIDKRICYLFVGLLLGIAAWGIEQTVPVQPTAQAGIQQAVTLQGGFPSPPQPIADFSCTNVSEIPQSECEALVALYDANSVDWYDWLSTYTPCSWYNVECENGHITGWTSFFTGTVGEDRLTNLPPEIGNLPFLTKLVLHQNWLTSLPPEIGNLTSLAYLGLIENQLTSLPPEIGNLPSLTELRVDNNQLTSLPPEIGNLTALTRLRVGRNQLASLPPEIGNLTSLTRLIVSSNQLTSLPTEIGNLTSLTELSVTSNQLTSLPPEIIGNLASLTLLGVGDNQLTSLPTEIGNLTALTLLNVSSNQLTSLPMEIGNFTALTKLDVSNNQLTSLPTEIGNFTALTKLDVSNNQLTSLPTEIGNFTALTKLDVSNNQLTSLPIGIGNMAALNSVNTSGNPENIHPLRITTTSSPLPESGTVDRSVPGPYYARGSSVQLTAVPATDWLFDYWDGPDGVITDSTISVTIGQENQTYTAYYMIDQAESGYNCAEVSEIPQSECEALVALYEVNPVDWGNWLTTSTPCSWRDVTCVDGHVIRLELVVQELVSLPPEIGDLSFLIYLRLSYNRLTSLPPEIGNLSSLGNLVVNENLLTSLPPEIGNLSSLGSLIASENLLTSLPPEIGNLSSLSYINVRNNQLTSLPAEIGNLTELNNIRTDGNPSTIQPVKLLTSLSPSESNGTIERSIPGPYYARGSSIQLTAVPATDWQFDYWEGPDGVISDSAISITMGQEDQTYTANFIEQAESGFNCANVSEIPQGECEALVALHDSTDGAGWLNSTDWLQTDTPCSWFGVTCASGQVSRLKLDANQLNGTIPTELGNLTALYLLSLTDNQLSGPLPAELGDLATLQFLYLFKNQLSGAIPAELGNLAALKILALQENQLSGQIPTALGNLTDVQRLFLHENQLSGQLPVELSSLPSLSAITLYDNPQLEQPVEINISSEGEGTITCNLTGPLYATGTALQLTAVPAAGWQFDYWEGPQISAEQSTQETVAITAGATNESYKAHFVLAIAAARDSSLIEETKDMLQDQGLRTGKTVDLLLPIVVK